MWCAGGDSKAHSRVCVFISLSFDQEINFSSLTKASYIIKINHITPIIDIVDPIELIRFQVAKLSGKSEYLLGIPANPKKC